MHFFLSHAPTLQIIKYQKLRSNSQHIISFWETNITISEHTLKILQRVSVTLALLMYNILLNVRPTWHKYLTCNSRTMMLLTFLWLLLCFNTLTLFMLWILIVNIPLCFGGLSTIMKSNSNVSLYSLFPLLIYVTWFRCSGIPVVPLTFLFFLQLVLEGAY